MIRRKKRRLALDAALADATPARAELRLVQGGAEYFDTLLDIIAQARTELHVQTYIFDADETGHMVIAALKAAAARDVRVWVMLDTFGGSLPAATLAELEAAGIAIRVFAPWLSWHSLHLGRRLHHKVVVADGAVALIGGINIADKYRGTATERAWLDYAVRIDCPAIARPLAAFCLALYMKRYAFRWPRIAAPALEPGSLVTILMNDWLLNRNEIYSAYRRAIRTASKEIIIVGTYFLPGRRLTNALRRAAKRGVKIQLILSGITDVPMLRRATLYLYSRLLRSGMQLYEWPHSVLHGKAAVVDRAWTTVGSFNLNQLSAYGSIEMNVAVRSAAFAEAATAAFEEVIATCEPIDAQTLHVRETRGQRFLNWASYHLVRMGLMLLTFTSYKRYWQVLAAPPADNHV